MIVRNVNGSLINVFKGILLNNGDIIFSNINDLKGDRMQLAMQKFL